MNQGFAILEKNSEKTLLQISAAEIEEAQNLIATTIDQIYDSQNEEEIKNLLSLKFGIAQNNILHVAAKYGDELSVEKILQLCGNDKNYIDSRNSKSFTPLHWAAQSGSLETVSHLLNAGADKNPQADINNRKWTPIHYATKFGHHEIVKALISVGVDIETKTAFGLTPLVIAAEFGRLEIVKFLLENKSNPNVQTIEDNHSMNALHYAAIENYIDIALELLSAGIDLQKKTTLGVTALDFAARSNHSKMVFLLLSWGAQNLEHSFHVARDSKSTESAAEILKYMKEQKNLFNAKWLKLHQGDLLSALEKFTHENLGESKIILSPHVSLNAYGILALRHEVGFIKKQRKTFEQFCAANNFTKLSIELVRLDNLTKI